MKYKIELVYLAKATIQHFLVSYRKVQLINKLTYSTLINFRGSYALRIRLETIRLDYSFNILCLIKIIPITEIHTNEVMYNYLTDTLAELKIYENGAVSNLNIPQTGCCLVNSDHN